MTTVQEIEQAITELTPEQKDELLVWMDEHYAQLIDDRLQADLLSGRFDDRLARALADDRAGRTRLL